MKPNINKNLLKLILLAAAVLISSITLVLFAPLNRTKYIAAVADKHQILENTPGPRIIFIGGSNIAFGLDSRQVKEKLGYNVVNMGLHANLGIKYMVNEIKPQIKAGDIIVIIPEAPMVLQGNKILLEISLYYSGAAGYLGLPEFFIMAQEFPQTFQRRLKGYLKFMLLEAGKEPKKWLPTDVYHRLSFNKFGDVTAHLRFAGKPFKRKRIFVYNKKWQENQGAKTVAFLNRFHQYVTAKKASLYFGFCPRPESLYKPHKQRGETLYNWLKKDLSMPLLGKPTDFVFPDQWFYDSINHLNKKGRRIRTFIVIRELKKAGVKSLISK